MQQHDRRAGALTQDFELDPTDDVSLDPHRMPYMRSLMRIANLQPALIAADISR